jgi:hypothetical protein
MIFGLLEKMSFSGPDPLLIAVPPPEPLRDGFVEDAVEGFYLIPKTSYKNNLFCKQDDLF